MVELSRVRMERVRRIMKACGLRARDNRQFKATTNSAHNLPVAPSLQAFNFTIVSPHKLWASDITYIFTEESWRYLVVVIDLFNLQVVGFALGERMTRSS